MPKLTKFWNDEDLWKSWKLKEHLVCCPSLKSEAKCPHLSKYLLQFAVVLIFFDM